MRTNKCPECDAHNTVKSRTCGNCGADITMGGKAKSFIKNIIILGLVVGGFMLYNMFQK